MASSTSLFYGFGFGSRKPVNVPRNPLSRRLDLDGDPNDFDLPFKRSQVGPKDCTPMTVQ